MVSVPVTLHELERRLNTLAANSQDPDGGPEHDEGAVFRLIDALDQDTGTRRELEQVGARYAHRFVAPYLHASDLRGVLHELDGLLAIHRRGRLTVQSEDPDGILVSFQRIGDGADHSATTFDTALVHAALRSRFPETRMEPEPGDTSYTFWRIRTR